MYGLGPYFTLHTAVHLFKFWSFCLTFAQMHADEPLEAPHCGWPVYVIGLDKNSPRGRRTADQMRDLGIEFTWFDAYDGRLLTDRQIGMSFDRQRNGRTFKYPLSKPEVGCYLSHLAVWDKIENGSSDGAFVFEDDFQACSALRPLFVSIEQVVHPGDVVSLHGPKKRIFKRLAHLASGYALVEPLIAPPRTTGYGITREAARRLCSLAVPFARPVDIDLKHWWDFDIRLLCVNPSALAIEPSATSAISEARKLARKSSPRIRFMRNARYQFQYHLNLVKARLLRGLRRP